MEIPALDCTLWKQRKYFDTKISNNFTLMKILDHWIQDVDKEYDVLNKTYHDMVYELYTPFTPSCGHGTTCNCSKDTAVRRFRHHVAICKTQTPLHNSLLYKQKFYPKKNKTPLSLRRIYKVIEFNDDTFQSI